MRDLEPYVLAWRARIADARHSREKLSQEARSRLGALGDRLVGAYGAKRVWLFGSLVEGGFREGSDIDLAAEGLPGGSALFRAGAELDAIASPFAVGLVPLEEALPSVREKVLGRGVLIREGA